jgi:hypothetical protein
MDWLVSGSNVGAVAVASERISHLRSLNELMQAAINRALSGLARRVPQSDPRLPPLETDWACLWYSAKSK